ncbi:MAG: MmcQ/YjbR family DNA-binding protein [Candidatus Eremiobacteraeota bacterium]|nr:MmcQ/YjbR family DNA-binding protein [Candidatus Eremiobacteraeota bacterium]
MTKKNPSAKLLAHALTFPGAWQDDPWGDNVVKVGKKIFAFIGEDSLTLKLTEAHAAAMSVPAAKPTAYGLGKAGWVTLPIAANTPPLEILCDWLEESYRAVAPKKLSAQLGGGKPV